LKLKLESETVNKEEFIDLSLPGVEKTIGSKHIITQTLDEIKNFIYENNIPYNPLHDKGFPSIGCAPCTRAVKDGEDSRAGRWWWETKEHKECGLHMPEEV